MANVCLIVNRQIVVIHSGVKNYRWILETLEEVIFLCKCRIACAVNWRFLVADFNSNKISHTLIHLKNHKKSFYTNVFDKVNAIYTFPFFIYIETVYTTFTLHKYTWLKIKNLFVQHVEEMR